MMTETGRAAAYLILTFTCGLVLGLVLATNLTAWHSGSRYLTLLQFGQPQGRADDHDTGSDPPPFAPVNLTLPHDQYMGSPEIRWQLIDNTAPLEGPKPVLLKDLYPRTPPRHSNKTVPFHWVIKSCTRNMYGRIFTTTLLSGIFNGLQPATISIVWCKPFNKDAPLPSLFYNLRHSLSINVFYPPEEWGDWESTTAILALMVPQLLGAPHVPLFVTEDDIIFAPDSNARIAAALHAVKHEVATDPYMMTFYWGDIKTFNRSTPPNVDEIQPIPDDFQKSVVSSPGHAPKVQRGYTWGAQAHLYSPVMTEMLRSHYTKVHAAIKAKDTTSQFYEWGQALNDIITLWALEKHYKCNQPGSRCHGFIVQPALVQHAGMVSAYFAGGVPLNLVGTTASIHLSMNFPMHVQYATSDNATAW